MKKKYPIILILFSIIFLLFLNLTSGDVDLSISEILRVLTGQGNELSKEVILSLRLPKILTAIIGGASLALCGLLLQTYFQNPLAGPFVLGIHSGSALFVSFWILIGQKMGWQTSLLEMGFSSVLASWVGSFFVMSLLFLISEKIPGKVILLVVGLLIGYFSGSLINVLVTIADPDSVKSFLTWSMGSFQRTSLGDNVIISSILIFSFIISIYLAKPLDLIFVGENFAKSMGVNPKTVKNILILLSSLLAASITSYCGPVAFVGMISPHLTRLIFSTENHKVLIPMSVCNGALLSLVAVTISGISNIQLPLNSIFGLMGAPFIVFFLLKKKLGGIA